jgi:hypothetical protein
MKSKQSKRPYRVKDRQKKDEFTDSLLQTRPSTGLLSLLSRHWKSADFQCALNEIRRSHPIPFEIRNFLFDYLQVSDPERGPQRIAWVQVAFAQAEIRPEPVTDDRSSNFLGFRKQADCQAFMDLARERKKPKLGRPSKRGRIDESYPWGEIRAHTLPELASALGITPFGLRKLCKRIRVRIHPAKSVKRSGTIEYKGVVRLLKYQLEKPINRERELATRIIKGLQDYDFNR